MASSTEKKLVRSKSGLRMVAADEKVQSPFTLSEPEWTPDSACRVCQNADCQIRFDLFHRKHHCRRCGKCFCDKCSAAQIALPRMCFVDPVRHCEICLNVTKKENEFFDKHLKVLLSGSIFNILDDNIDSSQGECFTCRLSQDHRKLEFVGENSKREPITIDKIESLQIVASDCDMHGAPASSPFSNMLHPVTSYPICDVAFVADVKLHSNRLGTGIAMRYKFGDKSSSETEILKMTVDEGASKKQGVAWIAAMQKAFKMICESKLG